jgi:hypothetical protein
MSDNSTTESNTNTQPTTELNDVIYYRERETASFYFKIAYTTHTATIEIPTNICIANFIEFAKAEIYNIFGIGRNLNFVIVEVGIHGEDGPALELDFETTIREKYNGNYESKSFYIRFIE